MKRGKPHPDIFLYAAETLGITTDEDRARTLVFEDGIPGVKAAVAAGMPGETVYLSKKQKKADEVSTVVWVPDEGLLAAVGDEKVQATQRLSALDLFKPEDWGLPPFDEA